MSKKELAMSIIEKVGGEDNIQFVTHCMTRLRFSLKDVSKADVDGLKSMKEILGVVDKGGQFQLIIGQTVSELFNEVSALLPVKEKETVEEVPEKTEDVKTTEDTKKKPKSFKNLLNAFMETISGCVTPLIPIMTVAGLIKLLAGLLGPTMLNVLPEDHNLLKLFTFVGDTGFYFFPIYVAYGAAKKFKTNVPLTLFMAAMLLHPTLIQIVADGQPFDVYGIPMVPTSYVSSFLPMILIAWAMSYVEKGVKKIVPAYLKTMLVPLLTVLIMLPIALCVLGPVGTVLGEGLAKVIQGLYSVAGPIAVGLVGALWPLLIATGMHQAIIPVAVASLVSAGHDSVVLVGASMGVYALMGIALAYVFKTKGAENKSIATANFISLTVGGISEPVIFGTLLRYKKAIVYLLISGFASGVVAGILKVAIYFPGAANILGILGFAGEDPKSFPYGCIATVVAIVLGFVLPMIFGFEDKKQADNKKETA